jgi:hypothetical protein
MADKPGMSSPAAIDYKGTGPFGPVTQSLHRPPGRQAFEISKCVCLFEPCRINLCMCAGSGCPSLGDNEAFRAQSRVNGLRSKCSYVSTPRFTSSRKTRDSHFLTTRSVSQAALAASVARSGTHTPLLALFHQAHHQQPAQPRCCIRNRPIARPHQTRPGLSVLFTPPRTRFVHRASCTHRHRYLHPLPGCSVALLPWQVPSQTSSCLLPLSKSNSTDLR